MVAQRSPIGPMMRARFWIEWILLGLARGLIAWLPWRAALAVGATFGAAAYRLGIRRRVVMANLRRAFPDLNASRRRDIAYQTYLNAGRMAVEWLRMRSLSGADFERMIEGGDGAEFIERAGGQRKPFVVLSGHMGNWELMVAYFAREGFKLKAFVKPLHNPRIESYLLQTRRTLGIDVIYTGKGLKPALRHLREGGVLVFVADQDARRSGIAVPFFGTPASTALGPALFAWLARVPILPVFAIRVGTDRHRFVVFPPIEVSPGEKRETALERLTRTHVEILEEMIRRYPDQYFWFHRRWKPPPRKMLPTRRPTPGAEEQP